MGVLIDERMLHDAISNRTRGFTSTADIKNFCLDFKNIYKFDNLWRFSALVKLQLQNNLIEKINGLDHLVHLKWLDLSFNRISSIEGIGHLRQLCNLNLYHNQISVLQGMDTLTNLKVLSLGYNNISSYEELIYLRKLEGLKCLIFEGNQTSLENYRLKILARLPNLKILDYKLVDTNLVRFAREQCREEIASLEIAEREEKETNNKKDAEVTDIALYKNAFISEWRDDTFITALLKDDIELSGLCCEFRSIVTEEMKCLASEAVAAYKLRNDYLTKFNNFFESMKSGNNITLSQQTKQFLSKMEDSQINKGDTEILNWKKEILTTEIKCSELIEDSIVELQSNLLKIVEAFLSKVNDSLSKLKIQSEHLYTSRHDELETSEMENQRISVHLSHCMLLDLEDKKLKENSYSWTSTIIEELTEKEDNRHRDSITFIITNTTSL